MLKTTALALVPPSCSLRERERGGRESGRESGREKTGESKTPRLLVGCPQHKGGYEIASLLVLCVDLRMWVGMGPRDKLLLLLRLVTYLLGCLMDVDLGEGAGAAYYDEDAANCPRGF